MARFVNLKITIKKVGKEFNFSKVQIMDVTDKKLVFLNSRGEEQTFMLKDIEYEQSKWINLPTKS